MEMDPAIDCSLFAEQLRNQLPASRFDRVRRIDAGRTDCGDDRDRDPAVARASGDGERCHERERPGAMNRDALALMGWGFVCLGVCAFSPQVAGLMAIGGGLVAAVGAFLG